jgi:DNA-binding transcriptional LysR family regulator
MHKGLSWDDARILLAVVRHGTQASASKALGIDQATVSRRLLRLEDVLGTPLFLKDGTRLTPTEMGQHMAERAEEAESSLATVLGTDNAESVGVVRIAAAPILTAHLLAPALPLLRRLAPGVVVELIAGPEGNGLSRRDADIALRLNRPGNTSFLARRIATVTYGVYARRGIDGTRLPWIGFDETLADLPEARWLAQMNGEDVIARASDLQTVLQAVRSGVCRGLLPSAIAKRDEMLTLLATNEPMPSRDLWLLVERQVRQIRRVSLTLGWVEALIRDAFAPASA